MARETATVEAEIASLRTAIARGIVRVRHGDTETTYANISDMRLALKDLLAELNSLSDTPIKQYRFKTSRGLD